MSADRRGVDALEGQAAGSGLSARPAWTEAGSRGWGAIDSSEIRGVLTGAGELGGRGHRKSQFLAG